MTLSVNLFLWQTLWILRSLLHVTKKSKDLDFLNTDLQLVLVNQLNPYVMLNNFYASRILCPKRQAYSDNTVRCLALESQRLSINSYRVQSMSPISFEV